MTIKLKPYQRERIARGPLINYTGPMSEFNNFLESDQAKKTTYNNVVAQIDTKVKKMKAGGVIDNVVADYYAQREYVQGKGYVNKNPNMVRRYEAYKAGETNIFGDSKDTPISKSAAGYVHPGGSQNPQNIPIYTQVDTQVNRVYRDTYGRDANQEELELYRKEFGDDGMLSKKEKEDLINRMKSVPGYKNPNEAVAKASAKAITAPIKKKKPMASTQQAPTQQATDPTKPTKPDVEKVEAEKIDFDEKQEVDFTPITAQTVTAKQATAAPDVEVTDARDAIKAETTQIADATKEELKGVEAAQGEVSDKALVQAQTVDATASAIKNVNSAQIDKAVQIDDIPKRKVEAEELVSGSAVKSAEVEQNLEKFQAAQMELDPMATTQGQLNKLLQDFDAGNPPPWAAAGMRAANAVLNQRGLGASSIAGQAIIQAQMEAAIPIAQSDAQTVFNLGIQNLSNRQQRAVLAAQQRAQFLGQEFDQEFQARVTNAARISDIANQNFNAEVQVTLENARMAQSVDLANLNNRQALVMADAAQIANLETANLNNRQQAAVQNAQAFLQMDLSNLQYEQQTNLFKAQEQIKAMFTDASAQNAASQFNASSENQVNQFYDSLANQTKQFNVQQQNAMEQFNVQQSNAIAQFNAQQQNAVAQFNASNGLVVSQANAEWRRNIATIDTAAQNQVNQFNAQNAMALTVREYEGMWQEFRDKMQFAHDSGENLLDRQNQYAIAIMQKDAQIEAAKFGMTSALYQALGAMGAAGLSGTEFGSLFKSLGNFIQGKVGATSSGSGGTNTGTGNTGTTTTVPNTAPFTDPDVDVEQNTYQDEAIDIDYTDPGDITYEDDLTDLSYGDPYK